MQYRENYQVITPTSSLVSFPARSGVLLAFWSWLVVLPAVSGGVVMGRCRSYVAVLASGAPLSQSQKSRLGRDQFYANPHSLQFVTELEPQLHVSGRAMLKGLQAHQKLSDSAQTSSCSAKVVAYRAYKADVIDKAAYRSSRAVFEQADEAKHAVVASAGDVARPLRGVATVKNDIL